MSMRERLGRIAVGCLLLGGPATALAGVEVGVDVAYARLTLDYQALPSYETRITSVGMWYREPVSEHLSMGLLGGFVSTTQSDNPETGDLSPTGAYLGLNALYRIPFGERFALLGGAEYRYLNANHDRATESQELRWHQFEGRAGMGFSMATSNIRLYGIGLFLSGTDQTTGGVDRTVDLREDQSRGGRLEWSLSVSGGEVALVVEGGVRDSLGFSFSRRF